MNTNICSLRKDIILGLLPAAELTTPRVAQLFSTLQEGMIDEHFGGPTALDVLVETFVDKVLEVRRPFGRNARRIVLHNIEKDASVML